MIQKQIVDLIEAFDTIIIHHHIHPDMDCVGSQLGLKSIIEASFKHKKVYAVGNHSEFTSFIGPLDVVTDKDYSEALVIIVDVGDKERVDDERFNKGRALIKIDHHPFTKKIADLEYVDTSFASCTEMIIDIYMHNLDKLVMTEFAAECLYAGMLTDTGRFYYNNVTERTFNYGAEVYKYPFNKQKLYSNIYYKSIHELKFNGYILSDFTHTENNLGFMKIHQGVLERFSINPEYAASQVNSLSNIKEVMMWIFFVEYPELNKIRVEFRSRAVSVNDLAKKYGGGGHLRASGALVDSWDIVDNIIKDADLMCQEYNQK